MRTLSRLSALTLAALAVVECCACGYGRTVDAGRFVSVKQNERGLVLYAVQDVVYRPASGWRAFPDGGVPLYVRDRNIVGLLDPSSHKVVVECVRPNREWQHGQGQFNIHSFVGRTAVVVESGQRRSDYLTDVHYYLLDVTARKMTPLPLKKDLEARGRDVGYFYLLDEGGSLLFVTPPTGSGWSRVQTESNEIWLRAPSGEYVLVARAADLYQHSATELIYWEVGTRQLYAYDVAARARRPLKKYVPVPEASRDSQVMISPDSKALELWKRLDGHGVNQGRLLALSDAR